MVNILKSGYKIYGLNEILTIWNKTNNSLSSSVFQKLKDGFNVYNRFMKFNVFKSVYYLLLLSINYLKKVFRMDLLFNLLLILMIYPLNNFIKLKI